MNLLAVQQQANGGFGPYLGIVYIAILALAFYFLIIKPGKKQKEQFKDMVDGLKIGDEVVTRSGIKGIVVALDDVYFTLETGNGAGIEFILNALGYIVTPLNGHQAEGEGDKGPVETYGEDQGFKSYDEDEDTKEL